MAQVPDIDVSTVSVGGSAYTVPFSYQNRSEVFVEVDGVSTAFTWINDGNISITPAPAAGAIVRRYRSTSALQIRHDYRNGVPFTPKNIAENNDQLLFVVQEATASADAALTVANSVISAAQAAAEDAAAAEAAAAGAAADAAAAAVSAATANTTANNALALIDDALQGSALYLRNDLSNPTDPAKGAALVGYKGRTVFDRLAETVSLKDFGAVGDGVADDTAAIQAAIDSGAKRIGSPAGVHYRITNTLTIDADRIEFDLNDCGLLLDDASGTKSHIKLGNGITQRTGIKVRNVVFARQQAATAGYAIDSDLIGVCEIYGCRIYGNNAIWRGIRIYRGIIINIQNNYIDNCVDTGIYLQGSDAGGNRTVDVTIRGNRVEGGVTALSTWDFVEGLFCRDNIFFNTSGVGVAVNASTDANGLVSFKFQENDFDTCGSSGLFIDKVSNIQVTGCWFSSNGSDDLQLRESSGAVVVVGNQFYPNASAINCRGGAARISGNLVSGGTTCIVVSSTATRTDISGNTLSNAQYAVDLGTATDTHFVANSIYGMAAGTLTGPGGAGTVVQNNKGDSAVASSAFIAVGASPFTYTAGARPECVSIFSGTVSDIKLGSNSIGFSTNRDVVLAPNQSVTVIYSAKPFMVKNIL